MTAIHIPAGSLFGLENLPYGIFSVAGSARRVGTRVGDSVVDLSVLLDEEYFAADTLNPFMAAGVAAWASARTALRAALESDSVPAPAVHDVADVALHLPIEVRDYVDFYASEHHASNLGRIFRPEQEPLTPNWRWLPIGYHGRAQTIVVSGTGIHRPCGQFRGDGRPEYGPEPRLDIECELAFIVGTDSAMGAPITPDAFDQHVFGVAILNDWSARAIQAWEYVPLGPHLGKSFASSLSAWITPMAALAEARVSTPEQGDQIDYLRMNQPWGLEIDFEVELNGQIVSRPPYRETFWSPAQMLAQMTANGASASTGDVFASGTISGPGVEERGAFIEITWNGTEPIDTAAGTRSFLEDGDEVVIRASAPRAGGQRIALGECRGTILAPRQA